MIIPPSLVQIGSMVDKNDQADRWTDMTSLSCLFYHSHYMKNAIKRIKKQEIIILSPEDLEKFRQIIADFTPEPFSTEI